MGHNLKSIIYVITGHVKVKACCGKWRWTQLSLSFETGRRSLLPRLHVLQPLISSAVTKGLAGEVREVVVEY